MQGSSKFLTCAVVVFSPVRPDGEMRTLLRPAGGCFVGDVDVDCDAGRLLFPMPGDHGCWQVFDMAADGGNLQPLPLIHAPDVSNYAACYIIGQLAIAR
ncbi:MAG: hypothetical protein NTV46_12325 [Verrucomicrobia bacterium]|nr:hypothetical protein [Verrucomicrobiota bacterium]